MTRTDAMPEKIPRTWVRRSLLGAGLAVLAGMAWSARAQIAELFSTLVLLPFLGAVVLGLLLAYVQGLILHYVLAKYRPASDMRHVVGAFLVSQPARYIPGKIWSAVVQSGVLGRQAPVVSMAAANAELAILVVVQLTALGAAFAWITEPFRAGLALALGTAASALLMLLPTGAWLARRLPRAASILRVEGVTPSRGHKPLLRALGLTSASMALNAVASWVLLLSAGSSIPEATHAPILAAFYLGFAVSMFAIAVPAGLGVREAATVGAGVLVAGDVPAGVIISVALLVRFWQLVLDGLSFALGYALTAGERAKV